MENKKSITFKDLKQKVGNLEKELKEKYPAGYDYALIYQVNPFDFFTVDIIKDK